MLQQTQTARVVPAFAAFLDRFPTVSDLAQARAGEVLESWRGLGYNRRAVALHRAARTIVADHRGRVPADPLVLRDLPGIGPYTANAVACFAYDAQVAVVDTNVRRVLSRAVHGADALGVAVADMEATATAWLPDGRAYEWNQALMDIGATVCRGAKPRCGACPLETFCRYRRRPREKTQVRPAIREHRFESSRRQMRGAVVRALLSNGRPLTVKDVARRTKAHPIGEVLDGLERDGLVVLGPAARAGSLLGRVRLP
jgi:A/G-specific adenine glycosylase